MLDTEISQQLHRAAALVAAASVLHTGFKVKSNQEDAVQWRLYQIVMMSNILTHPH